MPVSRPKVFGDMDALEYLEYRALDRRNAEAGLRDAVKTARKSGASIRVIAEHSGLSTRTVQDWLKQD